jgi:hypothetical protein
MAWVTPAGIPRPSSVTEKLMQPLGGAAEIATVTMMRVADAEVYLIAFVRPFRTLCRSRALSVTICGGLTSMCARRGARPSKMCAPRSEPLAT